jgi:WD40 repeat protein
MLPILFLNFFQFLGAVMKYKSTLTALMFLILLNHLCYSQSNDLNLVWEKVVEVKTMKFTRDGVFLVTGGKSGLCSQYKCGQIKIWNVADSSLLHTIEGWSIGLTNDLDIDSNNEKIISGHGSVFCSAFQGCFRDRAGQYEFGINGSQLFANTDPDGIVFSIAYSPDNNFIAAGTGYNNSGHINIFDTQYNLLRTLPGHSGSTTDVVFTPNGEFLISGGYDGYIRSWNYLNGNFIIFKQHGTLTNGGIELRLAVSPDGKYLVSTGRGYNLTAKIWRISDWTLVNTILIGNSSQAEAKIEFTPNGLYIAAGISFPGSGVIRFYESATGELVREYIDTTGGYAFGGLRALAFSPTENNLFAYSAGQGSHNKLRVVTTDLDLVLNSTPVELTSFNADLNNNNVSLNWTTASEQNNRGFQVEREFNSFNSPEHSSGFELIHFVEGKGTTTEINYYTYEDKNLHPGEYRYRLKQVDFDGSYEYSNTVEVEVPTPLEYSLEQNYPNPFNPATVINYQIPKDGFVKLAVYNTVGQEVLTLINEQQAAGSYSISFNSSFHNGLPSGLYFYSLRSGGFNITRKMVLLK